MKQLTSERLQDNLSRLKLNRTAEVLDTVAQQAKENKSSYFSFLDHLLEEEVAAKDKRRIQTAMRTAGLPGAKTIEEYDFSFHPQLDQGEVMELFDLSFITNKENVIFLGPPGVGKTHLAISLAIKACYHGFKVYFTTMDTLVKKLKEGATRRKAYLSSSLVVVDEVGYLPVTTQEAHLFFQFVSHRYERNSIIITSNKSFGDWQELFGDTVIATAILDRLLHHCKVINIKGHSYRLRGHSFSKQIFKEQEQKQQMDQITSQTQ
ncbi:MAG: IS21-like element helper ATPase IstB [Proteobacteria bacterium]|nr:IS21-like element helper ATPase IstB [Pseudomonadota bacterium]